MNDTKNDKFWLDDPMVLLRKDKYYQIVPTGQMSLNEKLNALTRFFILLALLLLLFCGLTDYLYVPIIGIIAIIIVYFITKNKTMKSSTENFKNQSASDQYNNTNDINESDDIIVDPNLISENNSEIISEFDIDSILGNSKRQFYTPPNNKKSLAEWLCEDSESCKENQAACLRYEDIRYNR